MSTGAIWLKTGPTGGKPFEIGSADDVIGDAADVSVETVDCVDGVTEFVVADMVVTEPEGTGGGPGKLNPVGRGGRVTPAGSGGMETWKGGNGRFSDPG